MLTVVTPAPHQRLTSLSALGVALTAAGKTAPDLTTLTALIDQASAAIAASCRRVFALETIRETFRPERAPSRLMLSRWPVVEIKSVTIPAGPLDLATVEAEPNGLLHRLDAPGFRVGWPSGPITVVYDAGYALPDAAAPTLPAELERAAILQALAFFSDPSSDPNLRRQRIEGIMENEYFAPGLTSAAAEIEALIAPHRAPATAAWC